MASERQMERYLAAAVQMSSGADRAANLARAEALVREAAEPVRHLGELLHPAAGALRHGADRLHAAVDRRGDALQRRLAVLDDVAQHREREEAALATLLLEDDLRERDGRQILARVVLEDLHVLAGLHPATDLVEGDVAALARVVELAVPVALDETAHAGEPGVS